MGKLIRNGIEYGGGNGTDIFEVDQDTYDTLKAQDKLVHNALYVISDAPNLNATSKDLSYDGGATSVHDKIVPKQDTATKGTKVNGDIYYIKSANVVSMKGDLGANSAISANDTIATNCPQSFKGSQFGLAISSSATYRIFIDESGTISAYDGIPNGTYFRLFMVYICKDT